LYFSRFLFLSFFSVSFADVTPTFFFLFLGAASFLKKVR